MTGFDWLLGESDVAEATTLTAPPCHASNASEPRSTDLPGEQEAVLPLYTCLDGDILTPANKFAYYEVRGVRD